MSAMSGHEIGRGNGRIAWPLLGLVFELVLRAGLADLRRRFVWIGVALLAVVLVSVGLVLSAVRSGGGGV
jgi:hypothetical protein